MLGWAFPITSFYAKELEKCNGVENIRVNTQLLDSGSAREQARLALSGKGASPYEIVHVDDPLLSELASQGKLLGLNDLIAKYKDQYDLGDIGDSLMHWAPTPTRCMASRSLPTLCTISTTPICLPSMAWRRPNLR